MGRYRKRAMPGSYADGLSAWDTIVRNSTVTLTNENEQPGEEEKSNDPEHDGVGEGTQGLGQPEAPLPPSGRYETVLKGETLAMFAQRVGASVSMIRDYNQGLVDANGVDLLGDTLQVP